MVRYPFYNDLFAQLDRLQREMQPSFDGVSPSIRGFAQGFPALNVGSTPQSVEIYAFAPGIDPQRIDLKLERGLLTLEGERAASAGDSQSTRHINERFDGRFRRVVSLPDDIEADAVSANYRDGVLHVSVQRRASAQPRRIEVQ